MSGTHDRDRAGAGAHRSTRRRLLGLAIAGGAGASLLTACTPFGLGDRVLVEMTRGNRFEPGGITIPPGATVVWYNAGSVRHTATCNPELAGEGIDVVLPAGVAPWSSGDLYPGQSWRHTFTAPGTYLYFCRYHGQEGMIGTISVVAS